MKTVGKVLREEKGTLKVTKKYLRQLLERSKLYATTSYAEAVIDNTDYEFYASVDYNENREPENLQVQENGEDLILEQAELDYVENYLYNLTKQEIEERYNEDAFKHSYESTGTAAIDFL